MSRCTDMDGLSPLSPDCREPRLHTSKTQKVIPVEYRQCSYRIITEISLQLWNLSSPEDSELNHSPNLPRCALVIGFQLNGQRGYKGSHRVSVAFKTGPKRVSQIQPDIRWRVSTDRISRERTEGEGEEEGADAKGGSSNSGGHSSSKHLRVMPESSLP